MNNLRSTVFSRRFSSASTTSADKVIASVLFERRPVIIPKIDPNIYAFQEFSFRWRQQFQREYPDEVSEKKNESRGEVVYAQHSSLLRHKGDLDSVTFEFVSREKEELKIEYKPAPRITEADISNDKRSLNRALDRRLYLLVRGPVSGSPNDKPVWHFPEKPYENEDTLRKCAESALKSVLGDLSHTYFVGNAPVAHMAVSNKTDSNPMKRFFFKSQVTASKKLDITGCDDFVWVTKHELLEYFPNESKFLYELLKW